MYKKKRIYKKRTDPPHCITVYFSETFSIPYLYRIIFRLFVTAKALFHLGRWRRLAEQGPVGHTEP